MKSLWLPTAVHSTVAVTEKYGVKVINRNKIGLSVARADGFSIAKGEIIASTDADTIVPSYWLTRIRQVFVKAAESPLSYLIAVRVSALLG